MADTTPYPAANAGHDGLGTRSDRRAMALLSAVGARVGEARKAAAMSRRELSEVSNVSQRYIAQLEAGQGNISIALLVRISDALGLRLEQLVSPPEEHPSAAAKIIQLLPSASPAQLRRILDVLDHEAGIAPGRAGRIALIGLRGAGKSTVGRALARHLSQTFLELNDDIEADSGLAVEEVIALYGQEGYRHLERTALERVVRTHDELVLAVAGGIVSDPDAFEYLLQHYHTVWLKAAPEEHMARVRAQGDERPMAGNNDAMKELRSILTSREAHYARADVTVDTTGRQLEQTIGDVIRAVEANGLSPAEHAG